jgi:integrase/recombinase XerD
MANNYSRIHLNIQNKDNREIYTYFHQGVIVALPTKWMRFLCRELRYSEATIYQYASNLKSLLNWAANNSNSQSFVIDDFLRICSRKNLQDWILNLRDSGNSQRTIRNKEATIKEFFEWMTSEDGGRVRSDRNFPYKTGKYITANFIIRKPKYTSEEEVIRLIKGYHNEAERCLAHFLYDTGLRISEAIRLRLCDLPDEINFPDGLKYYPLRVEGSKGRGRTYRLRTSILSSPVLARIRRYHNSSEYRFSPHLSKTDKSKQPVFLSVTGKPLSARNVRKQMERAAIRAGLPSRYSPHILRHGAAYSILSSELGKNYLERLVLVQGAFGHSQISTTEHYASIPPVLLAAFHANTNVIDKYEEAKRIYNSTFLPELKHTEKRGH